jgi:hypothetical protein
VGGDVVVVRAFYPLGIGSVLPASIDLSNMEGGHRLLVATAGAEPTKALYGPRARATRPLTV